jgi:hypothetical protein
LDFSSFTTRVRRKEEIDLISDFSGYTMSMQEETLTFEEIQELRSRRESGEYVPAEVMEAYFTIKSFLETKDVAKV